MVSLFYLADKFYKIAGLLAYPPKMKEDILNFIEKSIDEHLRSGKSYFITKININLEGLPRQYKVDRFGFLAGSWITVKLIMSDETYHGWKDVPKAISKSSLGGSWHADNMELVVNMPYVYDDYSDGSNDDYYNKRKHSFDDIVKHELSHFMQTVIEFAVSPGNLKTKPGYPSEGNMSENIIDEKKKGYNTYYTSGIEFFPTLKSQIDLFLRQKNKTKYDFLLFVSADPFFVGWKLEKPDLYKRAVKEAWKLVNDKLDYSIENEADGKSRFELWKVLADNKKFIINYADELGYELAFEESSEVVPEIIKRAFKLLKTRAGVENYELNFFRKEGNSVILCAVSSDFNNEMELIELRRENN